MISQCHPRQWSRGCRTAWRRRLRTGSNSLCLNMFASPVTKCRLVYLLPRFLKDLYWQLFLNWGTVLFGQVSKFIQTKINYQDMYVMILITKSGNCFKQLHSLMSFVFLSVASLTRDTLTRHAPSLQMKSVCLSSPFGLWCTTVTSDCMWSRRHFTVAGTTLRTVTNVQTFNLHYCWA